MSEETSKFDIEYGAMADPISEQILAITGFSNDKTKGFDAMADGINRLWINDILTDGERLNAITRLSKHISKHLNHVGSQATELLKAIKK